jgi:hypothetical protein
VSVNAETLRRLAALKLAPDAMSEVLSIIADIQSVADARKEKDRNRKRNVRGMSAECPLENEGKSAQPTPSREEYNTTRAPAVIPVGISNDIPPLVIPNATHSGAAAPSEDRLDENPKDVLYGECLRWLVKETGKQPNALRSAIGKMLKLAGGDANAGLVLGVLRDAKREQKADPVSWAMGVLNGRSNARAGPHGNLDNPDRPGGLARLYQRALEREAAKDGEGQGYVDHGNVLRIPVVHGEGRG